MSASANRQINNTENLAAFHEVEKIRGKVDLNEWRWSANFVTLIRFPFIPPMVLFFALALWGGLSVWWMNVCLCLAGMCHIICISLDLEDGNAARRWEDRYKFNLSEQAEELIRKTNIRWLIFFPGISRWGKVWDAIADKCDNCLALPLAAWGYLPGWMMGEVWFIIGIEALLFWVRPFKRLLGIPENGANIYGKVKTQCEGWTAGFMPFFRVWGVESDNPLFWLFHIGLIGAILFGLLSLYEHLKPWIRGKAAP